MIHQPQDSNPNNKLPLDIYLPNDAKESNATYYVKNNKIYYDRSDNNNFAYNSLLNSEVTLYQNTYPEDYLFGVNFDNSNKKSKFYYALNNNIYFATQE